MSRTHLYRGTSARRPLSSLVLAGAWAGAAATSLLAAAPALATGVPAGAAGLLDRLFTTLAVGALFVGLLLMASELAAGRTVLRGMRVTGALLLALAGATGTLDTVRRNATPGSRLAGVPEAVAAERQPDGSAAALGAVAGRRLLWTSIGLAGSVIVLAGAAAAVRRANGM